MARELDAATDRIAEEAGETCEDEQDGEVIADLEEEISGPGKSNVCDTIACKRSEDAPE